MANNIADTIKKAGDKKIIAVCYNFLTSKRPAFYIYRSIALSGDCPGGMYGNDCDPACQPNKKNKKQIHGMTPFKKDWYYQNIIKRDKTPEKNLTNCEYQGGFVKTGENE